MIIAIDFDGTCVTHEYPEIGKDIGAVPVLKWLVEQGHHLILWTMRGNAIDNTGWFGDERYDLQDSINWFSKHKLPLYGINRNPTQFGWTKSPKAYANLYIDDAALGCPLKFDESLSKRPFVDWEAVKAMLERIFKGESAVGHTTLIGVDNANS